MLFETLIGDSYDERDEWGEQEAETALEAARLVIEHLSPNEDCYIRVRPKGSSSACWGFQVTRRVEVVYDIEAA